MKTYRENGAIGALLDEYEKALIEFKQLVATIDNNALIKIVDPNTEDPDCKSIQTILSHVIYAGKRYTDEIRKAEGEKNEPPEVIILESIAAYQRGLDAMFNDVVKCFEEHPNLDIGKKRAFRWPHIFNVDMLMEHAIVHILRHRRQIERFLIIIEDKS